jgi:hypothetical protein
MNFTKWLDTFINEKGLDLEQVLIVQGPSGENWIPLAVLRDAIVGAPKHERDGIKSMIVKIDFRNGDVMDYFKHLAQAIAC